MDQDSGVIALRLERNCCRRHVFKKLGDTWAILVDRAKQEYTVCPVLMMECCLQKCNGSKEEENDEDDIAAFNAFSVADLVVSSPTTSVASASSENEEESGKGDEFVHHHHHLHFLSSPSPSEASFASIVDAFASTPINIQTQAWSLGGTRADELQEQAEANFASSRSSCDFGATGDGVEPEPEPASEYDSQSFPGVSEGSLECIRAINSTLRDLQEEGYKLKVLKIPDEAFMFWTEYDYAFIKECVRIIPSIYPYISKLFMAECRNPRCSNEKFEELADVYKTSLADLQEQMEAEQVKEKEGFPLFKSDTAESQTPPTGSHSRKSSPKSTPMPPSVPSTTSEPLPPPVGTYYPPFPYPIVEKSVQTTTPPTSAAQEQQQQSPQRRVEKSKAKTSESKKSAQTRQNQASTGGPPLPPPPPHWQAYLHEQRKQYESWASSYYSCPPPHPPPMPENHVFNPPFVQPNLFDRPLCFPFSTSGGYPPLMPPPLLIQPRTNSSSSRCYYAKSEKSKKTSSNNNKPSLKSALKATLSSKDGSEKDGLGKQVQNQMDLDKVKKG